MAPFAVQRNAEKCKDAIVNYNCINCSAYCTAVIIL